MIKLVHTLLFALAGLTMTAATVSAELKIPIPTPRPDYVAGAVIQQPRINRTTLTGTQLTLADAVFLGLRNNRGIKSAYIDRIAQKFDLRVAEDRFNPRFSVSGQASRQRIGNVVSTTVDVSPGVSMLTRTGAKFDFAWNTSGSSGDDGRTLTSTADIAVAQPLLRGAGIDVNLVPVKQARLGEKINRLRLNAIVSESIGNIIFAHRDLFLAQQELELTENAVARAQDLLNINRALIASGRMAKMDAVQTEADLEVQRLNVLQAKQQIEAAQLSLVNLLGLDPGTKVVAVESLKLEKIAMEVNQLIGLALALRPDYQGQLHVVEQNRLGIVVAKNEQLWDIDLFARGRFGSEFTSGSSARGVADIIGGIRFTIPINDLERQQQLVQADTTYRGSEIRLAEIRAGVETQIRGSAADVALLWQQLAIAKRSSDLAARAIEIEKLKLNAGRSTTFQVRSLEDNLRTAENDLLAVRIGYLNALTRLDLQLGTTLATWRIALKD